MLVYLRPAFLHRLNRHTSFTFHSHSDSYEPGLPCLSAIDPIPFSAIRPSIVIPFPPRLLHHIASFDLHTHSGEESQRLRTGIIDKPLQPSLYFKPRVASLATARVRVAPYSLSTIE